MSVPSIEYLAVSNQPLRVVIAGAGRMGSLHARALERSERIALVGAIDPFDPGWSVPWSRDCSDLLRRVGAQAVIVAVPPGEHFRVASACLRAGCHVLVEKPICPDPVEARRLAMDFRTTGRVLFGGHTERFHPVVAGLRSALEAGSGWTSLRTRRFGPAPCLVPEGGAVLDLGVHDLDLVLRMSPGLSLVEVEGSLERGVVARLSESGRQVEVQVGYRPAPERSWEAETPDGIWRGDLISRTLTPPGGVPDSVAWSDPLEAEHEAFRAAIQGGAWWDDMQPQLRAVEIAREILSALD